jgi:hypothetical protein
VVLELAQGGEKGVSWGDGHREGAPSVDAVAVASRWVSAGNLVDHYLVGALGVDVEDMEPVVFVIGAVVVLVVAVAPEVHPLFFFFVVVARLQGEGLVLEHLSSFQREEVPVFFLLLACGGGNC